MSDAADVVENFPLVWHALSPVFGQLLLEVDTNSQVPSFKNM